MDNRSNQNNPNNDVYWRSRGYSSRSSNGSNDSSSSSSSGSGSGSGSGSSSGSGSGSSSDSGSSDSGSHKRRKHKKKKKCGKKKSKDRRHPHDHDQCGDDGCGDGDACDGGCGGRCGDSHSHGDCRCHRRQYTYTEGMCCLCDRNLSDHTVGSLNCCSHVFHHPCIQNWSRRSNTCPVDNEEFTEIVEESDIVRYTAGFSQSCSVSKGGCD